MKDNLPSQRKIGFFEQNIKHFFLDLYHDLNICSFYGLFMVTLLKILLSKELILDFKGNVPNNQKVDPALVTQVDLIDQNWWESKISDNLF